MKKEFYVRTFLVSVFGIVLIIFFSNSNEVKNTNYHFNQDSALAIMVYDQTSASYLKQENIPVGNYALDTEKSYCVNGSVIDSYDSSLGQLKYTFAVVDECYVYFNLAPFELQLVNYALNWDDQSEASTYNVYSNDELLTTTTTNSVDNLFEYYTVPGTYDIKITALKSDGTQIASSTNLTYTIEQLTPLLNTDMSNTVDNSTSTELYIDSGIVLSDNFDYITYIDWPTLYDAYIAVEDALGLNNIGEILLSDVCKEYNGACIQTNNAEDIMLYHWVFGEPGSATPINMINDGTLKIKVFGYYSNTRLYAFKYSKAGYIDSAWYYGYLSEYSSNI